MKQIHGANVVWVGEEDCGREIKEADALVATQKNIFLATRVADCIPLLFFDTRSTVVAAAHAGWKGLLAGIVDKVIDEVKRRGAIPENIKVILGPSAKSCCYEVSKKLAEKFANQFGSNVAKKREGHFFLELHKAAEISLIKAGVQKKNIEESQICTIHNSRTYFSYRAEKTNKRNTAIIGIKE